MKFPQKFLEKGTLFEKLSKNEVRCVACQRCCIISEGKNGFCRVRYNIGGELYVPFNYVSALAIDPIEKKPVYHFLPGSLTLSFSTIGCNFKCLYCQNYDISQIFEKNAFYLKPVTSDEVVDVGFENNVNVFVATYNEPTVFLEWGCEVFEKAKRKSSNIKTGIVTNGYLSRNAIEYMKGKVDFVRIDFKSFDREKYRKLTSANLDLFIKSVEMIFKEKFHIEFVTLIVEGFNDEYDEIKNMAEFIKTFSLDIPWHLTRFHPDYKMMNKKATDVEKIERLISFVRNLGIEYVYGGNYITDNLNTYCPSCKKLLIRRDYMRTVENRITNGKCPYCDYIVYGQFL